MSIRAAQSAALSALQTSQAGISVSSENIANASVEGYTAKSLSLSSSVTTGASTGVTVTSVGSTVDSYLLKSISEAASESGYASVFSDPLNMVASQFGDVGDDGSISTLIADLETSIAALAVSADSQSEKSTTLSEANAIADELNNLSQSVQDQRASADQSIEDTVDQINDLLNEIHAYNNQLSGTDGTTLTTSELEDARAQAINELSELVDISYYTDSSNTTQIYIGGTLVVGSQVQELSYNAVGTVTSDTTFADITVNGNSITDSISGGSLGGLIELRDETLPDIQEELDNLATTLMDSINAVTNLGTAYPAPSELVGSEEVDLTDAFSGTGAVRLAATDEDGNAVEIIEIDLSTITTVQDLVDAINSSTYLDASVGSDGTLEIAASDDDYGVSIINMDASVGADDQGFSDYFGLNDMFTGTDAGNISVNSAWLDDTSRLPVGSGSDDATLAVGDSVISSGSSDVAEALADLFDENVSFDAAGNLGSTKTTLSDYAAEILSDVAQQASSAETEASVASSAYEELVESFSNQYGVNTDEEALTLSNLQSAYEAAAAILEITQSLMDTLLEAVS